MKVVFDEIPVGGLVVDVHDAAWFPDQDYCRQGEAAAGLRLERQGERRVLATGWLRCRVLLRCDRCLDEYVEDLDTTFSLDIECLAADDPLLGGEEHICAATEMDVQYVERPEIDILALLGQQVHLSLPVKHLCRPQCRGLCPGCGRNRNTGTCSCTTDDKASPFAVLAGVRPEK